MPECGRLARRMGLAMLASLALLGCASTPGVDAAQVQRLQQQFVQAMPLGRMIDRVAASNAQWPLQKQMDRFTSKDLACVRGELTREKGDAVMQQRAADYAARHPARVADDIALLDAGVVQGLSVSMGATMTGQAPHEPSAEETKALVEFMTAPAHRSLRLAMYLDALESVFLAPRADAFDAGRRLGARMMLPLVIDAMKLCGVDITPERAKAI